MANELLPWKLGLDFHDVFVTGRFLQTRLDNGRFRFKWYRATESEQFRNSFFVRTALDWNLLPDSIVNASSADIFTSSVGTFSPPT